MLKYKKVSDELSFLQRTPSPIPSGNQGCEVIRLSLTLEARNSYHCTLGYTDTCSAVSATTEEYETYASQLLFLATSYSTSHWPSSSFPTPTLSSHFYLSTSVDIYQPHMPFPLPAPFPQPPTSAYPSCP